ncbi:thiazole synthase [Candidatus Woesearchaeota archaeon]|nr:thiazole synthase [Candidatus Woesearchaeota archaeon]|tara:strand:+ start:172 stop:939 length:768 start_codon:yes stop_codon:yes gene_type:complete
MDKIKIGKFEFNSRLFIGTGKYSTMEMMEKALDASGAEVVTVALRRVNFEDSKENILNYIDQKKYTILPNTAGCYTVEDAVRITRLGRELGLPNWIKLEVMGDEKTLMPDNEGTLKATKQLVDEGFTVLAYTNDDIVACQKLEKAGAASVMPLGAPIGSGQGVLNPNNIKIILENAKVPIIVDAGVGTASDVTVAMELGADGVLLNTGVALAKDPVRMARAMKAGVEAGRDAFLAGRIPKKLYASASSPIEGIIK